MDVKEIRDRQVQAHGMTTCLTEHTFRKASGAASVDDVDGVSRLDRDALSPTAALPGTALQLLPVSLTLCLIDRVPEELLTLPDTC